MPLHQSSGRWRLGLALSLLTVFLWGVLPIALAVTLQALDVYTVTWFRFVASFGLLALYLAARQQLPPVEKLRSISGKLIAIAIIFLSINYVLFLEGVRQTSPSNAEVLIQLAPVSMGLGALVVFKEHYTLRQWAGLGILTLGFALFFHEQLRVLVTAPANYLIGSGITLIAAVSWAIYGLAQKQLLQRLSSFHIMLLLYAGCGLIYTPLASPQKLLTLSPLHWGMLIFCGLNTLIAYGAFAESLEHWEASRVSAVLALAPIVTLIAMEVVSWLVPTLIAPENITVLGVVGAFLVVAGSMAIALGNKKAKVMEN